MNSNLEKSRVIKPLQDANLCITHVSGIHYINSGTVSWDDSEGETGEVEDRASSAHSKDMLGKEIEDIDNRPEGEYCILKT